MIMSWKMNLAQAKHEVNSDLDQEDQSKTF